jgi:hypothetical protein
LSALVVPRKARLWDIYVERWRAKTRRSDGRLLEAFMGLFADAYDRLQTGASLPGGANSRRGPGAREKETEGKFG